MADRETWDDETLFERIIQYLDLPPETSRRGFLRVTAGAAVVLPVYSALGAPAPAPATSALYIVENAQGLIVADSTRCVGCKRCELACTEFNDGKASPKLARVKVSRNYNYGPRGDQLGVGRDTAGEFGNFRVIQDTCKQCPHPVPCADACPNQAIVLDAKTGARVVDVKRCTGCRMCQRACPWEMVSFDEDTSKATKCFLCNGAPECVANCSTGALKYVPWRDLSRAVPIRQVSMPAVYTANPRTQGCSTCHEMK
jgi:Fe-S-cluster-containing dehydrogenase component